MLHAERNDVHTRVERIVEVPTALAVVALVVLCASTAWGQDATGTPDAPPDLSKLSLEQLVDLKIDSVYGASAYLQKVTEAPASVTIVTAEQIRRYGFRTLADVLRSVRGFYVTYDRNYSYVGVRGFSRPGDYNARILLLIDGHRLNDNVFGSALVGSEFPLDIALIERLEVIRGPSSSLYGTSAFFAVINVITRGSQQVRGTEIAGALSNFETGHGRVSYGHHYANDVSVVFSGTLHRSNGQERLFFEDFDSPDTNNGVAEHADRDGATQLFGTASYRGFRLQGLYGTRDKRVPTASFGTVFGDPRTGTIETQGYIDLSYQRDLHSGWHLASRGYYDRYGYDGDYVYDNTDAAPPPTIVNKDFARGVWWGAELTASRRLARRHLLAVGTEFRDNVRQDQYNYDQETGLQHLDDRRHSQNWAVFVQDEFTLSEQLRLNFGARHDQYDTFGGTTNPRIGVIYNPVPKTTLKLLYGQAFRAPNAYELFWHQTDLAKANSDLHPETNRTSEFVLEQYVGSHLQLTTTAFHYTVNGLITQQTDPLDQLLVYNNVDTVKADGVEVELEGKWRNGLESFVSYTLQNSRNAETDLRLTNSPTHVAHVNVIAPLGRPGLFAGFELGYLSSRRTIAGSSVGAEAVANLTIFKQRIARGLDLSASLYNLFGTRYSDPASEEFRQDSIPQDGRTARVWLTITFPRTN